jgi:hypothetical protein
MEKHIISVDLAEEADYSSYTHFKVKPDGTLELIKTGNLKTKDNNLRRKWLKSIRKMAKYYSAVMIREVGLKTFTENHANSNRVPKN